MLPWFTFLAILLVALTVFFISKLQIHQQIAQSKKARARAEQRGAGVGTEQALPRWHSLPVWYGSYQALWMVVPTALTALLWLIFGPVLVKNIVLSSLPADFVAGQLDAANEASGAAARGSDILNLLWIDIQNIVNQVTFFTEPAWELQQAAQELMKWQSVSDWALLVLMIVASCGGLIFARHKISPHFPARHRVERFITFLLVFCSLIAIMTTAGIVLSLLFETLRFFREVPPTEFLFGLSWSPQTAIREDQIGSSGAFGAVPLFLGTLLISFIAMIVAVPLGLLSAIYISEYAPLRLRSIMKPVLEILAGVPTVVYGFFAILTVAPAIKSLGDFLFGPWGYEASGNSALAAGLVMGIMILPFISSLSDDVMKAVPQSLRDGSAALGATKSETIRKVVFPAALPGIVGAILLAISRAIGETMIVLMAAGLAANLTLNPFEDVSTVTVWIVQLLTGDQEFDSAKTLSAFALGMMLFVVTLSFNVLALRIVRKYRERYE